MKYFEILRFILLSALIMFRPCPLKGQSGPGITLEAYDSIGAGPSGELYQMADVTTDRDGTIYLTDMADNHIKKYNMGGYFLMQAGERGKADAQFEGIRLIATQDGLLYLTDQFKSGIRVFDKNGSFKTLIPFSYPIFDLSVESADRLWIECFDTNRWGALVCINSLGEEIDHIQFSFESPSVNDLVSFSRFRGSFIVAFKFKDTILRLNEAGQLLWKTSLNLPVKQYHQRVFGFDLPGKAVFKDIAVDTLGYIFVLGGHFSENSSRDIFVLDPDGHQITTLVLSEPTHCLYIDHRNVLYTRAKKGSLLQRYKLRYH